MVYVIFVRRKRSVINKMFIDKKKALKFFSDTSKKYPNVSLEKRRKNKLQDDWRKVKKVKRKK